MTYVDDLLINKKKEIIYYNNFHNSWSILYKNFIFFKFYFDFAFCVSAMDISLRFMFPL
jgi:hypothetical protein